MSNRRFSLQASLLGRRSGSSQVPVRWNRGTCLVLAGLFWIGTVAAWSAEANPAAPKRNLSIEELFGDPVVARGKGLQIKQSQIDQAFIAYLANMAARGQRLPESQRDLRQAQLLDRMIITQLLTNRATKMDRTVAMGMSDKFFANTKKEAGSEEAFLRQLKSTSITPEQFNQRIFEQALAESVVDRELKSAQMVSDAELDAFYKQGTDELVRAYQTKLGQLAAQPGTDPKIITNLQNRIKSVQASNLANLESPEKVHVAHILISTRVPKQENQLPDDQRLKKRFEAESLLKRAQAGEDFIALVKQFSEDRRLSETGGEYTLARNEPYAPEFVAACFSLMPGQVSDIVTTVFGHHIIKLLEKIPPQKKDFASVKDQIRDFLLQQKVQVLMPDFFKKLKTEAGVEILEPKYAIALPDDDDEMKPGLPQGKGK